MNDTHLRCYCHQEGDHEDKGTFYYRDQAARRRCNSNRTVYLKFTNKTNNSENLVVYPDLPGVTEGPRKGAITGI